MTQYTNLQRGVFGWNPVRLAEAYTTTELAAASQAIAADPANANPQHAAGKSIYLYTATARKKMDALAWAIYHRGRNALDSRTDSPHGAQGG